MWSVRAQALVVMALDRLHRRHPHLTCALVGDADLRYAGAISSFVAEAGLSDVVRIVPFQSDLRPWW